MIGQSVGAGPATVEKLLEVAIRLEVAAGRFYEGLAERFAHCPEVAGFWRVMAADEACHENRLAEWRASLSAARLSQRVDARMLQMGEKVLGMSVEELLRGVHNLDEAYETAHDLESSETNTIFRFFIAEFSHDQRVITALMQDLDEHVERLTSGFPSPYATRAARRGLIAACVAECHVG
jgi:rubrerythrin